MIRCVNCGGISDDNALACKYCGRTFADRRRGEVDPRIRPALSERERPAERTAAGRKQSGSSPRYDYGAIGLLIVMLLTGLLILHFIELVVLMIRLFC